MVNDFISYIETSTVGYKTTMVRCVLRNGFEIIETSACVDARNYDQKLGEEIWEFIGGEGLLAVSEWPKYDEGKTIAKTVEIGVQVNGKVRGTIVIPNGCEKEKAFEIAKADERIASFLEGKNLIKEIYVPNKIVNFVAK